MTVRSRKTYVVLAAAVVVLAAMAVLKAYGRSSTEPAARTPATPAVTLTVSVEKARSA